MPTNYPELYFPVLVQVLIALAVASGLIIGGVVLGQRVRNQVKDTPYECGIPPTGSARERFSVKFYLVAMIFILFDIEVIFLFPWAVVFRELGMFAFVEMLIFISLVFAGFFYVWKKGVLDWSHEDDKTIGTSIPLPQSGGIRFEEHPAGAAAAPEAEIVKR